MVKKNKKKAIEFYEKAAALGNGDALLNLGVIYYTGDSVSKDVSKAVEYFSKVSTTDKPIVAKYPYVMLPPLKNNKEPCMRKALLKRFRSVPKNLFGLRLSHNPITGSTTVCIPTQAIVSKPTIAALVAILYRCNNTK